MTEVNRSHRQRAAQALRLPQRLNPWVETGEDMYSEDTWHPNAVARVIAEVEGEREHALEMLRAWRERVDAHIPWSTEDVDALETVIELLEEKP